MYENNYPNYTLKLTDFNLLEYKTIIKNLDYISNTLKENKRKGILHIDLFNLENYDSNLLTKLLTTLYDKYYYNIISILIYINKNNISYLGIATFYITQQLSSIPIELIKLENEIKWK